MTSEYDELLTRLEHPQRAYGAALDAAAAIRALTAQVVERETLMRKLMLVVDDDEQIYNKDTDDERLIRAKRIIATHWGLDDFEWEPDE
ncbi:hypothetical protein [Frondihabitans sp. VKM Ac-2883]|uniref:hypothetical protein n=1 Tax=Frondihabitans sp. VKM Ac-2883 TaxID=2783823 RepID=UPI00188A0D82|nr:hypothetical protein [Frondihabitans sp. VKM Ac-2883]MBF4574690.1 hypothetical protein [Frondihabitans sp. VKM Ac-2883]